MFAEDSGGGENYNSLLETSTHAQEEKVSSNIIIQGMVKEIYDETTASYTNLKNAIPVEKANITIKDPNDDEIIATANTNPQGEYNISFQSSSLEFRVEIEYSTYKTYSNLVTFSANNREKNVDHTFMPDIALIASNPEKGRGIKELNNRRLIYHDMWNPDSQKNDWIMEHVNFAFLDMAMPGTGMGDSWYPYLLYSPANLNNMISTAFGWPNCGDTDTGGPDDLGLRLLGFKDGEDTYNTLENTYMGSYYYLASDDALKTNLKNMVDYIYYLMGESSFNPTQHGKGPLMGTPSWGIYHPDHPNRILSVIPSPEQIKIWIEENYGYSEPYYSLKWIEQDYGPWTSKRRNLVYQEFEQWYDNYKSHINTPFIVIASYGPGGMYSPTIDALIREYETQGRAVFNLFQQDTVPPISSLLEELVIGKNDIGPLDRGVSAITSLYTWSLNYPNLFGGDGALSELERMNIAAIKGLQLYDQGSLINPLGAQYEWTFAVTYPYFEGVFSPTVISYNDKEGNEQFIDAGIKKLVKLTNGWARLKELPNQDKTLAIILYNYPPGKSELGASYLDVFVSIHDLLHKLQDEGYYLGNNDIPSVEELYTLIADFGNKGSWAQPLLDKYVLENKDELQTNGQIIDVITYHNWFRQLPLTMQEQVIQKWGDPMGDIMTYDGSIVIPGFNLGNIFITVQPSRGWEEVTNYHDSYLPPHHQYIAFYNWLENNLNAHAMIHMGTHGTLEWLPGRNLGLQEDDWPFQLANIPNINPYIVSNPGEGLVAKDRAGALIIDHMIPAMVRSGLYGELVTLHDLIHQYENAVNVGNYQILPALETQITNKALDLGFKNQAEQQEFEQYLKELHIRLHEIENDIIPLGLHHIGKILEDRELVETVFTIASSRTQILEHMKRVLYPDSTLNYQQMQKDITYEDEIESIDNKILSYLQQLTTGIKPSSLGVSEPDLIADLEFSAEIIAQIRGNQEWQNLINALNGGFVTTGLGADPSYADVLPTGKNFYGANPRKMPTPAAWETAQELSDILLADYYQQHGKFPETVGMVMWGTELLRTDGLAIAQFLYLMGVQPVWNPNGDVQSNPTLIPIEDLKITIDGVTMSRPRVDVFVTAVTGNELWINLMNNAVNLAAQAPDETIDQNYIKKHILEHDSLDRIFGLRGLVLEGTGVSDLLPNTGKWQDSKELADLYLSRVSYAWRSTSAGVEISQNQATFQYLLANTNLITQNIDSTWRLLDTDDYYDWYGGMLLASRNLGGNPDAVLADIRNKNNMVTRTLQAEIELQVRSQLLNPAYMDSLFNTPSGWIEYASRYENLYGMSVTTGSISNQMWTMVGQNLLSPRFTANNNFQAHAIQTSLGWVIEAARKGFWQPDSQLLTQLSDKSINLVNQYGVTCCHHTCANLAFNQYVMMGSSLSISNLQQFANTLHSATGINVELPSSPGVGSPGEVSSSPGVGSPGEVSSSPGVGSPGEVSSSPGVGTPSSESSLASSDVYDAESESLGDDTGLSDGEQAYEVTMDGSASSGASGVPMVAIIGVIFLISLVAVGFFKNDLLNLFRK